MRARGLEQIGPGGGTGGEDIIVHRVRLADIPGFLDACRARDCGIDVKMLLLLGAGMLADA
jgi:ADP-ribose pyrophosphatase